MGWAVGAPRFADVHLGRVSAHGQVSDEPYTLAPADPKPPTWGNVSQILSRNCTSCHGEAKSGGIDLRTYESTMASKTVVKGRPEKSSLVTSLKSSKGKRPSMPQGRPPLAPKFVKQIEDWVKGGAPR
ncbi:MAG: c-type cytochrome domain-containing protein [Fimbriimonadaceae bacterium]